MMIMMKMMVKTSDNDASAFRGLGFHISIVITSCLIEDVYQVKYP